MQLGGTTSRLALLITLLAVAFGLTASSALATTFNVNKRGDHAPGACNAADCTLREAVIAATALPSNDRLKLPSTKPYKLKRDESLPGPDETAGDLDVGVAVGPGNTTKIVHPGSGKAKIDASATGDRVIEVVGNIDLRRVKLTGGIAEHGEQSGGALNIRGFARLTDVAIVGNEAPDVGGGIFIDSGVLLLERTKVRRNVAGAGGGIFVNTDAYADVVESSIDRNSADDGGGLWIETGPLQDSTRLIRSTMFGNEATGDGAAIFTRSIKGRVENSTLAGNSAGGRGGAIYAAPDSATVVDAATIADNRADADNAGAGDSGGGIFADGGSDVVEIRNSLVAENRTTGGAVNECDAPAPVGVESLGGNLITTTAGGCTFFPDPEDHIAGNAGIKDLAANGGPTKTIALKANSPAIDEADGPGPLTIDQRGEARDDADIGAYER
ncbi:MAG: choice-of-anchor Q domain-containing protein [Solirubrobacterales bacterium]